MTTHQLTGIVLKLNRAERQLNTLGESIGRFVDPEHEFYDMFVEMDAQERIVFRVKNVEPTDPEWGVLIGEVVYNLRSALDHLAYELAVVNHGTRRLPRDIAGSSAFPIFNSGPKFHWGSAKKPTRSGRRPSDSGRHKIRGIAPKAQAAIERLQPYHRRKNPNARALLQLEELSNIDKHRTVHLTATQMDWSRYGIAGTGWREIRSVEVFRRAFKENAMVARITVVWDKPVKVDVDTEVAPDVAFDEGTAAKSVRQWSVLDTLLNIRNHVAGEVIPALMPYFPASERIRVHWTPL